MFYIHTEKREVTCKCGNVFTTTHKTRTKCDECIKNKIKEIVCVDCGKKAKVHNPNQVRCTNCAKKKHQYNYSNFTKYQATSKAETMKCPKCNKVMNKHGVAFVCYDDGEMVKR